MSKGERWRSLVMHLLKNRESDKAMVARVRRGISDTTETWAYADVLPYADDSLRGTQLEDQQRALLRASAIIVSHVDIPQVVKSESMRGEYLPLGKSMLLISRKLVRGTDFKVHPDKPDIVAARLRGLAFLDLDEAANTFNRLLSLADDLAVPVDYYALTERLLRWGRGVSPESLQVRKRTLSEYYLAVASLPTTDNDKTQGTQ